MLADPFSILVNRFHIKLEALQIAYIVKAGAEPVNPPQGISVMAYSVPEIPGDCFHVYDLVVLQDYDRDDFAPISPVAWRMLKPNALLFVASHGGVKPKWAGWKMQTFESVTDELYTLYKKTVPTGLPLKLGTNQDAALATIDKTGRRTKRKAEEIGRDKMGLIAKWYLLDCTLYFKRPFLRSPYLVYDIGEREPEIKPAGAGAKPNDGLALV